MQTPYEIYDLDSRRVIATASPEGRALASEVLGGHRAEADAAQPTGFNVELTEEQYTYMARHGWAPAD